MSSGYPYKHFRANDAFLSQPAAPDPYRFAVDHRVGSAAGDNGGGFIHKIAGGDSSRISASTNGHSASQQPVKSGGMIIQAGNNFQSVIRQSYSAQSQDSSLNRVKTSKAPFSYGAGSATNSNINKAPYLPFQNRQKPPVQNVFVQRPTVSKPAIAKPQIPPQLNTTSMYKAPFPTSQNIQKPAAVTPRPTISKSTCSKPIFAKPPIPTNSMLIQKPVNWAALTQRHTASKPSPYSSFAKPPSSTTNLQNRQFQTPTNYNSFSSSINRIPGKAIKRSLFESNTVPKYRKPWKPKIIISPTLNLADYESPPSLPPHFNCKNPFSARRNSKVLDGIDETNEDLIELK